MVRPCPSARWWRDPECIESRIFADFRRASFTHEWAPAGSPGRSAPSAQCIARQPGPRAARSLRPMRRRGACVPSRTHTRTRSLKRAPFCVFWNAHTASASPGARARVAHGPLVFDSNQHPRRFLIRDHLSVRAGPISRSRARHAIA